MNPIEDTLAPEDDPIRIPAPPAPAAPVPEGAAQHAEPPAAPAPDPTVPPSVYPWRSAGTAQQTPQAAPDPAGRYAPPAAAYAAGHPAAPSPARGRAYPGYAQRGYAHPAYPPHGYAPRPHPGYYAPAGHPYPYPAPGAPARPASPGFAPQPGGAPAGYPMARGRTFAGPSAPAAKPPRPVPARTKIESRGLCSWYGKKQALDNIDLAIGERSITALVGPSGCGKSTYLRCINRMNDLVRGFRVEGSVTIEGHEVYSRDTDLPSLRRNVGMVFQHPNPFPMSIYDNIALAVKEHAPRTRKAELDEVVERSLRQANLFDEVKDQIHQSAFAISGGQQQRLCIARALAITPDVLMLDEPCASLDPVSTARIEELLLELERDYTIVIVTHNLAQARRISDQMAFFLMGRLVEHGPTWHMLEHARFPETRDYLAGAFG